MTKELTRTTSNDIMYLKYNVSKVTDKILAGINKQKKGREMLL